jgi:hypothetical protein
MGSFYTGIIPLLLALEVLLVQTVFEHNSAYVSTQDVHMAYFGPRSVLDHKDKFGQLEAPPHETTVMVGEIP